MNTSNTGAAKNLQLGTHLLDKIVAPIKQHLSITSTCQQGTRVNTKPKDKYQVTPVDQQRYTSRQTLAQPPEFFQCFQRKKKKKSAKQIVLGSNSNRTKEARTLFKLHVRPIQLPRPSTHVKEHNVQPIPMQHMPF